MYYDKLKEAIPENNYVQVIEGKVLGEPQSYDSQLFFKAILYNKAKEYLDKFNFKKSNSGYKFLMDALQIVAGHREFSYMITKNLYPEIAEKNSTTAQAVERNIRTAINNAFRCKDTDSEFRSMFDCEFGHITNGMFINEVSSRIWAEIFNAALE